VEYHQQEIDAPTQRVRELEHWEYELDALRDREGEARMRVGAAEQRLKALEQQRTRRARLMEEREQLDAERTIFEELRIAFGKDGVPAMIIEAAIPEIEQEANQILSRMTDGRMHLRFDTQREKVTGGTKETLDIKIADELGTRDYSTFSGGEAFRVNFAIRLALSRLLARRAGAQLRTLIIDEGFGTQDTQGRERLVQAINAIQEEFDLILVITHIDELRDAFPARIEITKTPYGSQIEVV
jgi:exonuclease SbcC